MNIKKNKTGKNPGGRKIFLIIWLISLFAVFGAMLTILYINRDAVYNFLFQADIPEEPISGGIVQPSDNPPDPYEYFSDIIFIGDSIMTGFDIYRDFIEFQDETVLKNAVVAATPGYGVNNAVSEIANNEVNLYYGGKAMRPEDIIAERDEKYVFICLGINDLVIMKLDKYIEIYRQFISNIQIKNPDKIIVILSITPLVAGRSSGYINNEAVISANNILLEFAQEYNIPFVDWAESVCDTDNSLRIDLSSDGFCHLKIEAYDLLVEYLLYHPVK